jgi:hypothetical protein
MTTSSIDSPFELTYLMIVTYLLIALDDYTRSLTAPYSSNNLRCYTESHFKASLNCYV